MGIKKTDLVECVITPALLDVELFSQKAVDLLLGTAAQESHLGYYLRQISGPASGIYQMEPNTYKDIWGNYLYYKPELVKKIKMFYGEHVSNNFEKITYDLRYATVMARIHYLRVAEALPEVGDVEGMANYWKKYYNTYKGKGITSDFIDNYQSFIQE